MTEIDFGTLVTAVVDELNCTTSELFGDEKTDPDLAVKRYNRNVIGRIREVFDEAEAPAPVPPTCSNCGAVLGGKARFCGRCGMALSTEAADELLADLLAENVGTTADNPNFRKALARIREEMPEQWDALVQKIGAMAKE
ncbi:MAG TPA: zinc ribbon domain-containing protein [Methanoculleus sp.]|nr:zinc ribbon domain-containing protein [Methanoculleus sp.]